MSNGIKAFVALGGDLEPLLACGWLLSMVPGATVTAGLPGIGSGAGPFARGFMDLHILRQGYDDETLLRAAATQARRLAALLPGDGSLELVHEPPVGNFDVLLVGRPAVGKPLSSNPAFWNSDAKRFRAVLVAPREPPSCLGRSVTVLADGPPRNLPSFDIARRLFPTMTAVHLILDEHAEPDRASEWLRLLACQCPVQISMARRTTDTRIDAVLGVGSDVLVVERPVRSWPSMTFNWRLAGLLDRTLGAILFAL